ncbi:thiolase family protein [Sphingobium sp. Sx8-8]|uniref:thiolase family protein n=1 Tax=Sphingobium sp. Sx8-8 TaxID=2933617 RepID=UPI001F5884F0|nr:thiolase family protein [Sphingobium sp. Sx8-8]
MTNAVIISAVRTAVGTARKGTLANTRAEILAATVVKAAVERAHVPSEEIDDVILAESMYGGGALARHAAVELGILQAGGMAVNRHCAGSLSSVGIAAGSIVAGMERVVVAGGVTSASTNPAMRWRIPGTEEYEDFWMPPTHPDTPEAPNRDMSITVGWNTAQAVGLTREEMDRWALRSHQRAVAAIDEGRFKDEIVPVQALQMDGSSVTFEVDEHPRRDSSLEKLASLKVLHPEIEGFSITAGNSSGVNDAGSALTLASEDYAKANGLSPIARVLGWTAKGVDPRYTGLAATEAIQKLLARTNRRASDIALWEINEAFASVPMAACRKLEISEDIVNISGSGCSIGHPISASGGRMLATLINDLRRRGGGLGIAAMCAGGGQGGAVLIEV